MIPIVNFMVIGYKLVSTGFTKEKVEKDSLPEWKNYGDLFMKGLKAEIIGFLLFLPAVLVLFGALGTVIMSAVVSMRLGGISTDTWNKLMTGQITEIQMQDWLAQNWTQFIHLIKSAAPLLLLRAVLASLAFYITPVAVLGWLKEGRFSAAFSWKARA